MLYGRNDLGYTVEKEVIIDSIVVILISELNGAKYQVIDNGCIKLNTVDFEEAKNLFRSCVALRLA